MCVLLRLFLLIQTNQRNKNVFLWRVLMHKPLDTSAAHRKERVRLSKANSRNDSAAFTFVKLAGDFWCNRKQIQCLFWTLRIRENLYCVSLRIFLHICMLVPERTLVLWMQLSVLLLLSISWLEIFFPGYSWCKTK